MAATPYETGQAVGRMLPAVGLAVFLAIMASRCLRSVGRPGVHPKGAVGLSMALVTWSIACVLGALMPLEVLPRALTFFAWSIAALCAVAAVVLGGIALIEIAGAGRGESKTQSILAVSLAVVMLGAFGFGAVSALRKSRSAPREVAKKPSKPPEVRRFPDKNFQFTFADPWDSLTAQKINPLASLALMRIRPVVSAIVIAEESDPPMTSEQVAKAARANVQTVASSADPKWHRPHEVNGLRGVLQRIDAEVKGQKFTYVIWTLGQGKRVYQVVAWGAVKEASNVEQEAKLLLEGFDLLDRDDAP